MNLMLPLLVALAFGAAAAAAPFSYEKVWREARAAFDRADYAASEAMTDEALRSAGDSNEKAVWELRVHRATLFAREGKRSDAEKILARPFPKELEKTATAARRLVVLARVAYFQDSEKRDRLLKEALAIAAATGDPEVLAEMLYRSEDLADVQQAVRLAKKSGNQILLTKSEVSLVRAYALKGQFDEAAILGEAVRPRLDKLGLIGLRKTHLGNLGWIYAELGDYERGRSLLTMSLAEAARLREPDQIRAWATTLSSVLVILRDWNGAVAHAEHVIQSTANQKHRSRADAFASLARAYVELGRLAEARSVITQARALERDPEEELAARIVEARIDAAEKHYDAAEKTLAAVIAATEKPTTKLAAIGQIAQVYAETGKHEQAQKEFERALGLVRATRKAVSDMGLRLFFFNTTSDLYDHYIDFLVARGRHEDALRVAETSRAQTLAEELDVPAAETVDARKIARQRNAVILSYWLGRWHSYLWKVTPADVRLLQLAKNDTAIEKDVEDYQKRLVTTAGTLQGSGNAGRALYSLLVAPAGIAAGSRVIVIPDGRLHMLNFETLVVPAQKPRYWIEDAVVSHAGSLQLLTRGEDPIGSRPKMLIVGNPPTTDANFPALTNAAEEIQRIERQFAGAKVLKGAGATPASYEAAKPQTFDIVHFVAHGVPNRTSPLDSAVILAADKDRNYRLLARRIAEDHLAARLVTISSCYGAGSATFAGEGLVGLAWAFLNAGADQVVAALWAVSDSAAPDLMADMYAGILGGKDPADALREAKLRLMRSGTSHRHARFWAPFVVYL